MAVFEIPENLEYIEDIRKFETNDPGHADVFNSVVQDLVNNDAFLKRKAEQHDEKLAWFWNCGNGKADVAKSVDAEGFRLFQGVRIVIRFQLGNTAADFTMNVNGTGNIPVRYRGAPVPADYIRVGHFVDLVYYDNCWNVVGDLTQAQVDALETRLDGLTPADIGALSSSGNAVSASKWNTVRKINGMSIDGTTDRTNYGVCSTSGSTTAKTVSCTGFSLVTGAEITVKFNNTNTASNPTLNVNSTGAKAIYYKGAVVPSGYIAAKGTYTFRYNGTQWELVGDINTDTTYSEATASKSGLMSAGDKAKVDSLDNNYADKNIYGDTFVSMGRKAGTYTTNGSFAFGRGMTSEGDLSVALGGYDNNAQGNYSVVLGGDNNVAATYCTGVFVGRKNTSNAVQSVVVGGIHNIADNKSSCVLGKFNKILEGGGDDDNQVGDVFVVGNGTGDYYGNNIVRSNALRVTYSGSIYGTRAFQSSGADYAEFIKPWADGNPEDEDRVGYFVTVKDGLLYKANEGDYIYGITSGNPSIVGNADEDYYWRYERDEFNRIVMEDVPEMVQRKDEEGNPVFDEETHEPVMVETGNIIPNARMKLAEGYDPSLQGSYIERKDRKEWDYVGMLGVLPIRDDGTCLPDHYCKCGQCGIATFAEDRGFDTYMVIERISDNIVSVILK